MTKCMKTLSSLAPKDSCPICGSVAIDHNRWRRGKARDAGISLEEWEAKHWTAEEDVDHVQETLGEMAADEMAEQVQEMLESPSSPVQYRIRAVTDPFEISLHELLDTVQRRVVDLRKKWGPFASLHEMESVIREEVGEFTAEVFREKKRRKRAKAELVDIITAAARAWAELDQGEPLSDLKASKKQRKALAE